MKILQILTLSTTLIFCLIAVAFVTLLERKILGYMQMRLGPNKVGSKGIMQPFSDAVKLYTKEMNFPDSANFYLFFFSPCTSLSLALMLWLTLPIFKPIMFMNLSLLIFFSILGLGVYPILIAGWSSNSNFSLIGGMRALAQTVSYEVSLVFILMSVMFMSNSMSFFQSLMKQKFYVYGFMTIPLLLWTFSVIAELNRTPFDFAEGESELVSGFNTEYSSGGFAIIFMAEYLMILFFSNFSMMLFFKGDTNLISLMNTMIFMFFILWMRATLPRFRYDKLMDMCWKIILPISTLNIFISISFVVTSI